MDNKTWLWRKRSSEKTIVATNKFGIFVKGIDEETQNIPVGNGLGPVRRNLNEKLTSVLVDCHAKDDPVTENEKSEQRATAGQEKTEAEVDCLKKELDGAPNQGVAANEKLSHSDAALKKCMQQLNSFREEHEQKIHDAVMEAKSEFERAQKTLEGKLMETSKRLTNLAIENTNLSNALLLKEKLVEELHKRASQTLAEFNTLMARLDSSEKENAFLKYEFHMLQKELEVRNEELEYNRRSSDASRRQHLESVGKVTKLEAECQRLRTLMRKRLPGPTAFSKIKSEVEMLGKETMELRRKPNLTRDLVLRDPIMKISPEIPVKNIDFLIEQLRGKEEENKVLREMMTRKNAELQSSRIMFSRTASRLSQVEAQVMELSGDQKSVELTTHCPSSRELLSPIAGSDAGSWANALISELEHFRDGKLKNPSGHKAIEVMDMSLMDDFVEMEKLAMVSTQTPSAGGNRPSSAGKELVPAEQEKQESHLKDDSTDKSFDWLQVVLNAIFIQQRISKRSLTELLEDINIALGYINHPNVCEPNTSAFSRLPVECDISGYITWKSPSESSIVDSLNETPRADTPVKETSKQHYQSNLTDLQEENDRLKNELNDMEARLHSANDKSEALMMKLRESEQSVERLQAEVEILKESKGMIEDQIENQKSINEDLDTQLTVTKAKLNEVFHKFSSLEVEFEDKSNCCEELEATCLELQLQLESAKETPSCGINEEGKQPQDGWEIKAASVKLAECQETILNLGKQLKALASPREAALFDKVFTTTGATAAATNIKNMNRRFSLRDQMIAEDRSKAIILRSPTEDAQKSSLNHTDNDNELISTNALVCAPEAYFGPKHKSGNAAVGALAIIPSKKQGFGLLRSLLMRRKKGTSKKSQSLVKV
ncbi:PREDICTED: filament-like plant protein 7 [Populus euphratica]|uniref:Filament-like plant protein 7 n=1 Tax=Populus euphratica TaxID=75702 RepID=A0AAJ6SY34_POPEU|nr:PREDICTED: filament-like plant protein 7 [Populus euphratica]